MQSESRFFRGVRADVRENYRLINHLGSGASAQLLAHLRAPAQLCIGALPETLPLCLPLTLVSVHLCPIFFGSHRWRGVGRDAGHTFEGRRSSARGEGGHQEDPQLLRTGN